MTDADLLVQLLTDIRIEVECIEQEEIHSIDGNDPNPDRMCCAVSRLDLEASVRHIATTPLVLRRHCTILDTLQRLLSQDCLRRFGSFPGH